MSAQCRKRSMLSRSSLMVAVSSAATTVSSVSPSTSCSSTSLEDPPKSGFENLAVKKTLSSASSSELQSTCDRRKHILGSHIYIYIGVLLVRKVEHILRYDALVWWSREIRGHIRDENDCCYPCAPLDHLPSGRRQTRSCWMTETPITAICVGWPHDQEA